ncbi:MAG: flagellar transcriptional regulator FlhD [Candidatus Dactylopiibacterium carminicum]|uniref:Flagellar transcriptional regulator FlhD n=1 Tax=Candidatus Dactylopiibacterium carminicum TaxID=857335 RepID=A0A272EMP4_9RHOO|nr:flagellar transcriptional regulator FlhD [Candidatus Dactylopiibacterium carminicum]KAF7597795.1 flagellar transcriptional regulator FlhD [Candidatus Dactylopiibacterium carminicum]PAS91381.1 MAG: flagellar transcriptional regulator FlhD [Candidatus Dactylopiibacterium carminicum]PAS95557.1 MAG: flagellar transcriptional regulator FlhD [Candidatus Dactylopiibacterium carminicum]
MGNEIREMNLSYLMLAQQMLQSDRVGAMLKLGVGEDVAELIENLTPAQILRMASCDMLLCRFRFDDNLLVGLLSNHGADSMVSRLHATILAAGKPVEHLA